uniref:Uncharacterized protein n=1 Tax=Knipowitschia caucasica TaxID=637954 RepID=A0AAV2M0B1_KNICA
MAAERLFHSGHRWWSHVRLYRDRPGFVPTTPPYPSLPPPPPERAAAHREPAARMMGAGEVNVKRKIMAQWRVGAEGDGREAAILKRRYRYTPLVITLDTVQTFSVALGQKQRTHRNPDTVGMNFLVSQCSRGQFYRVAGKCVMPRGKDTP